jgi:hypothetical protein
MTYTLCKKLISKGNYDKDSMVDKLDVFLLNNRITDAQYNELIELMNA